MASPLSLPLVVLMGQECSPDDDWVPAWEEDMKAMTTEEVKFFYPPKCTAPAYGYRLWHPYTPLKGEEYDHSHRGHGYEKWIEHTAAEVWEFLDYYTEEFAVVALSNSGAVAFEIAKAYGKCKCVLWTASVPVLSQQNRSTEVSQPTGFLHGTRDRWYFGGHDAVKEVAEKMGARWSEYDGGHSNIPVESIKEELAVLLSPIKKRECEFMEEQDSL